ncbi:ribonuclease H-like domain-containing protein [Tanacetum coccineum]
MADNRTMAQLLQAPTEGYEDAIVIPEINANFELKHGLINLVQNKQFFGHDKEDPHAHIRYFNKITSTMRFPDIPSTSIKLMLFPFSLEVVAKVSSNSSTPGISPDVAALTTEVSELKNMMKTMLIDKQKAQAPAPVKAVEQSCVTCGGFLPSNTVTNPKEDLKGIVRKYCKVLLTDNEMSEAENHPPASSVTALRIPIIKKGEYDLWCMKMRQYITITDHILWDIITIGDQATTEPASSSGQPSAPKTSIVVNARRNNEKALNILLSAIPDRHLLSFHDAQDAQSLWTAIKARFGGNKESKKMQKNLLKQQFETFVVGAREELDSAYERFQNIISMLELYDAKVSCEDANLKFLRSLPPVWHVVATMIRGQPGLDELDFDDLYNNLKVYEHELKGASSSNSQSIAFVSAEIKSSTSRQNEIICSFFAQQASMPETHDDEDLLQIDDDAIEEIDIRWQVAMITARIRKFMRKTGRPIDLKSKNGITFNKSKIECFNCQKLGHFARECKFAKYQANRANGSKEKIIVPIEDSNSKALVAKDSQGEIDWTKEFDDDPMVALNGIEEDDWSIEIDADHVDLGQDGLGVFDWSEEADNAPVVLALMATSSTNSSNSKGNPEEELKVHAIIDSGCSGITCLVAKATKDEAVLWHRRLGHVNYKNINKLVKGNLVRGLPSKTFKLDHSCLAYRKGKQHRASCKKIKERTVREPLELLHMDLFGHVSVESVNRKKYYLVVTDDYSRFSWVFFLAYKDETYDMFHDLIVGLENKLRHKVKTIRCDHGTEFKNQLMNECFSLKDQAYSDSTSLHSRLL